MEQTIERMWEDAFADANSTWTAAMLLGERVEASARRAALREAAAAANANCPACEGLAVAVGGCEICDSIASTILALAEEGGGDETV